ncbi:protein TPX2-like isoform X1 [Arachis stenosperma]|uniref:protein TPX2-like isoform X1 n=1 Tax=Arachis stenosperma TaxID=217475 RepID=UPI0025AC27FB|nr:protein TPX2-like isoform X1 [Arachis stenosperma]
MAVETGGATIIVATSLVPAFKPRTDNSLRDFGEAEKMHKVYENQAIKRQKLEGGKARQILYVEPQNLPRKLPLGVTNGNTNISSSNSKMQINAVKGSAAQKQMKPRPKDPGFKTDQAVASASVRSTTDLDQEMVPRMPKFKAQPLNKKENPWKPVLTEPKTPTFQTSLRARPQKMKSSVELELEKLARKPKFKARPLNKKIFESKGDIGLHYHAKKQVTVPQEFHFATNDRIPPPAMADLSDLFYFRSESTCKNKPVTRNTIPKPFHLHTEERGDRKEKKHHMELLHKPYPYTNDYPQESQKLESKQCTKPEPFQLDSLVRHEIELQQEMEEQLMVKREEDPFPVTDKVRKPLTQVQEFSLHSENWAMSKAQFNEKREEEKALNHLTRSMVSHVMPTPKFDHPFFPNNNRSAKDTTNPESPNLHVAKNKISNAIVVSSPAATMR